MSGRLFDPSSQQPLQPRNIVPQMDVGSAGMAQRAAAGFFGRAAGIATELEEARQRAEAADAEATGRARMTVGLAELRRSINEGDPSTIRDRWQAGTAALREAVAAELPESQRGRFGRLAEQMVAGAHDGMLETHARRTGDVGRANLLRSVDDLVRAGVAATDPRERMETVGQIDAAIGAAIEGGLVTAEAAERMRMNARNRLDRAMASHAVSQQRGRGPAAVRDMPGLSDEQRAELIAQATREMAEAGAEAEAEEQQATSGRRAVVDERVNMLLGGQEPATVDEVMDLRHDLPPERHRALMTLATGGVATRDDPAEVGDLTDRVGLDAEGSYRQRLDDALADGRVTRETHRRLSDLDMALRAQDPASVARREARGAILDALDIEGMDPSLAPLRTRALEAWEEWTAANPQAGPIERREALQGVIRTGQEDMVRTALRSLPRPGMVQMRPGQPPKLTDLDKAEGELLDALDAIEGTDDAGEAALESAIVDELALIERWRAVATLAEEVAASEPQGARR